MSNVIFGGFISLLLLRGKSILSELSVITFQEL